MTSQNTYLELMKLSSLAERVDAMRELRQSGYDWDANFDYEMYGDHLKECKGFGHGLQVYREGPIWQIKRQIRIAYDLWECVHCGRAAGEATLSVDHKYTKYREIPYESIHEHLSTICWGPLSCHEAITNLEHTWNNQKHDDLLVDAHRPTKTRIGVNNNGNKYKHLSVSAHRRKSADLSQRTTLKPSEQVGESHQGD